MRILDPNREWRTLLSFLPADYEELALEHRVLRTQWLNSKLKTAADLLRLVFVHVGADLPLRQTVAIVAEAGGPDVSAVRLHLKMREAARYLEVLVARMLQDNGAAAAERWDGYELLAVDATAVAGPGASGTDARVHAVIRLSDLSIPKAFVTDGGGGETLRRFTWEPGQLVIADRGYANPPGVAAVVDDGADVLVRVNRGALPLYDPAGESIDVLGWLRALPGHRASERPAVVHVGSGRQERHIVGRLVGFRLPDEEAAAAREWVVREHGPNVADELLEAASYVVLFTTAPRQRLSAARCIDAYRLRWQVELQFKRWKSICHFDRLPNYRDDTIRSWLLGKVLLALVLDRIGSVSTDITTHMPPIPTSPLPHRRRPLSRQPWKITSLLWPALIAAILPMGLSDTIRALPALASRLDAMDGSARPRQVEAYLNRTCPEQVPYQNY